MTIPAIGSTEIVYAVSCGLLLTCVIILEGRLNKAFRLIEELADETNKILKNHAEACLKMCQIGRLQGKQIAALEKDFTEFRSETSYNLKRVEGLSRSHLIKSTVAARLATAAHDRSIETAVAAKAKELSTVTQHFIPQKDIQAFNEELEKLVNPGSESFDWNLPFTNGGS